MPPKWPSAFQPDVVREAFGSGLTIYVLAVEAWRRGLTVSIRDDWFYRCRISDSSGRSIRFTQSRPNLTSLKAHATAKNKHQTNQLLAAAGLPVPRSVLINPSSTSPDQVVEQAVEIGYPVVLKPLDGAMGQGVFSNIRESAVLRQRFAQLQKSHPSSQLVLESHVPGDDYRILVFGGHYIAACQRIPANITGDGVSTVQELIDAKNLLRRKNPFLSKGPIKPDQEITDYLQQQGHDYNSVPSEGEYLQLRGAANASAGGDVVDVTDQIPEHIRESAVKAAQAIPGLHCAGVDILYEGTSNDGHGQYTLLELNSQPQIGVNMYPTVGTGVDVPKKIIDICFPDSQRSEEPADQQLHLNLRSARSILRSGHVSEVVMPPIPASRYRTRRLYNFIDPTALSPRQRTRIFRASQKHHVAGFLRMKKGDPELMVAGSDTQIDRFVESLQLITGTAPEQARPWKGVVAAGFTLQE